MLWWLLMLLVVRWGYAGRGGAGPWSWRESAEPRLEADSCCRMSAEPRRGVGSWFCSCWRMLLEGTEGARCETRLLCSSMLVAQASRSTGVRFAAWRKASWS